MTFVSGKQKFKENESSKIGDATITANKSGSGAEVKYTDPSNNFSIRPMQRCYFSKDGRLILTTGEVPKNSTCIIGS